MSRPEKLEELLARWDEAREQGRELTAEELSAGCPELLGELRVHIRSLKSMDWLDRTAGDGQCGCGGPPGDGAAGRPGGTVPRTLAGRYRLEGLIAEGGFGQVWRATDTALLRPVAVKVTTLECVSEARRVARLKHHGIISVHDVGHEAGLCFIVFDLVEGTDLARHLARGRPEWRESARLVAEAATHLHYAHEQGFVHRDIKPANILLDEAGRPVLADFGIAVTECELRHEVLTSTGTLAYMSPEQLSPPALIDCRTDVYSLGVVLYELLTGRVPFVDQTVAGLRRRILTDRPPTVRSFHPEVPPGLERVCLKCLSKEPGERYASARELSEALLALLSLPQAADPS